MYIMYDIQLTNPMQEHFTKLINVIKNRNSKS